MPEISLTAYNRFARIRLTRTPYGKLHVLNMESNGFPDLYPVIWITDHISSPHRVYAGISWRQIYVRNTFKMKRSWDSVIKFCWMQAIKLKVHERNTGQPRQIYIWSCLLCLSSLFNGWKWCPPPHTHTHTNKQTAWLPHMPTCFLRNIKQVALYDAYIITEHIKCNEKWNRSELSNSDFSCVVTLTQREGMAIPWFRGTSPE